MSALSDALLDKARESLAGAASEFGNGRYNNVANRTYYACYQAAVAALDVAGIRPPGRKGEWSHGFVQAQFAGLLINQRKRYPTELRDVLGQAVLLREQADYKQVKISRTQASRVLSRTRTFVDAVVARESGGSSA